MYIDIWAKEIKQKGLQIKLWSFSCTSKGSLAMHESTCKDKFNLHEIEIIREIFNNILSSRIAANPNSAKTVFSYGQKF